MNKRQRKKLARKDSAGYLQAGRDIWRKVLHGAEVTQSDYDECAERIISEAIRRVEKRR